MRYPQSVRSLSPCFISFFEPNKVKAEERTGQNTRKKCTHSRTTVGGVKEWTTGEEQMRTTVTGGHIGFRRKHVITSTEVDPPIRKSKKAAQRKLHQNILLVK